MSIETILFDVGGVIVVPLDPVANIRRRRQLAADLGFAGVEDMWNTFYTSDAYEQAKIGRMVHTDMWHALLAPRGLTSTQEQEEFVARLFADEGMLPQMRSLIKALRRDYQLGILSNWDDRLEEILEDRLNIAHHFDAILNSHRIGVAKPDEEAFQIALRRLQASPQEVLFIDDLTRNTDAAAELGLYTHHYRDFSTLLDDLRRRDILD